MKVTIDLSLGLVLDLKRGLMGVFKEQIGVPWEEDAETRD